MINVILFGIAIAQIIGGISVIFFDYNISIRGIYWGSDSFQGNIIQISLSILIILYVFYDEYRKKT